MVLEKSAISVIGKTILRCTVHVKEKLSKLNELLLTNTNFSLTQQIFTETLKICLTFIISKINPPIGKSLYPPMVLQYPMKKILVLNVMLSLPKF